ncbi:MAG: hypothetical protein AAF529_08505 [Pseudomonadota bacterium]
MGEVYLNATQASGVRAGDVLKVSKVVRRLIDPATGLLMDTIEREVGQVEVGQGDRSLYIGQSV